MEEQKRDCCIVVLVVGAGSLLLRCCHDHDAMDVLGLELLHAALNPHKLEMITWLLHPTEEPYFRLATEINRAYEDWAALHHA